MFLAINVNDFVDMEAAGIISESTPERSNSLIINISQRALSYMSDYWAEVWIAGIKGKWPDLQIQLDHVDSSTTIEKCGNLLKYIDWIMLDGSSLAIEENVNFLSSARNKIEGIIIEGAEGKVGENEAISQVSKIKNIGKLLDVGIEWVSVSVGNLHSLASCVRIDYELIQKIVKRYPDVHLVLHGADNLKSDEIRMVIESGIKKINFGPKYRMSYLESLRRHSAREDDPRIVKENVIKDLSECVNNYCIQCGI